MLLGGVDPPPGIFTLLLGGSDPPPRIFILSLGGSDPPPRIFILSLGGGRTPLTGVRSISRCRACGGSSGGSVVRRQPCRSRGKRRLRLTSAPRQQRRRCPPRRSTTSRSTRIDMCCTAQLVRRARAEGVAEGVCLCVGIPSGPLVVRVPMSCCLPLSVHTCLFTPSVRSHHGPFGWRVGC